MKKISLATYLKQMIDGTLLAYSATFFQSIDEDYPVLFFTALQKTLKQKNPSLQLIDSASSDAASFQSRIATAFLDQSLIYFVRGLEDLDAKKSKKILPLLFNYAGPHSLIMWVPPTTTVSSEQGLVVTLPAVVDQALMITLATAFDMPRVASNTRFFKALFTKLEKISLESACLLCSYGVVLGTDTTVFTEQWLDHLVQTSPSLFTLSQHFFARDVIKFGTLWHSLRDQYQMVFWITFWSEQLFRAAGVIRYQEMNNQTSAKKIGYRLPFSFLSHDWKKYSYNELMQAHNTIYEHDVRLKNGGSEEMIELFYAQFFAGQFKG